MAQVEDTPAGTDDKKLECCVIVGAHKDKHSYHITKKIINQISNKIWDSHGKVELNEPKNDSAVLYHIDDEHDIYNLDNPITSDAELTSLLTQFFDKCGDDTGTIYLLAYDDSCKASMINGKSAINKPPIIGPKKSSLNNFIIEIDLKDLECDDGDVKLEFSLHSKAKVPDASEDSKNNGDDMGDEYKDNSTGKDNTNERDLWINLWQKLQYQLTMRLYQAGIKQWENTHTLYHRNSPTAENEKKNDANDFTDSNITLVKSMDDLIGVAKVVGNNVEKVSQQARIVLKIKSLNWAEEFQYLNQKLVWVVEKSNDEFISGSENVFNFLMQQMLQRTKIVHNLQKQRRRNRRDRQARTRISTALSHQATQAMEHMFNVLVDVLNREGLSSVEHDILCRIDKAKKAAISDNNWEKATRFLENSMKSVKPFDIDTLVQCYGEISHVSNELKDGNLVLFIGRTGSGKSTTIHFLKGTTFVRDPKHQTHLIPDDNSNISDDLKHIKLDYQVSESVTKYITPVTMSLNDVIIDENVTFSKNRIILCDTPGIGDSHGIEVEVANSLSLIRAIRNANSVCIVLVLSDEEKANRSELFKHTGHYLQKLLSHYKSNECDIETKLEDIGVIFTKFKEQQEIWDFFDKFVQEADPSVDGFYLAKKIANQSDLILIDPIASDSDEVIPQLLSNESRSSARWINNTAESFRDDIPAQSLINIRNQVRINTKSIEHLSSSYGPSIGGSFSLIEGKLKNLTKLSMILESQRFIRNDLDLSTKLVYIRWKDTCDTILKNIKNHSNVTLETFNNNIIKARKMIVDILEPHSKLQSTYLTEAPSSQQMIYELRQEFCNILQNIDFSVQAAKSDTNGADSKGNNKVSGVLKCLVIATHFVDEKQLTKAFIDSINGLLKQCEKAIKQKEFLLVKHFMDTFRSVKDEWTTFCTNSASS